jgi:alanine racemase
MSSGSSALGEAELLRDTRLEVDLDALEGNARAMSAFLREGPAAADGKPPKLAAVLKADGYGLGAVECAGAFIRGGAAMLAVACLPEALELRRAYPEATIMVMGHTPDRLLPLCVRERIVCTLWSAEQARALSDAARSVGATAGFHLKLDTGMNRLGLRPGPGAAEAVARLSSLPGLHMAGVFTHLALVDAERDRAQFEMFMDFVAELQGLGVDPGLRHVCDSIGLARYPEYRLDLVRAGAALYGLPPLRSPAVERAGLRTAFALRTRISRLRRLGPGEGVGYDHSWKAPEEGALLATLPIGYADGYRRSLSNKGAVLIHGVRAPVVGLVCMDQCTADVSAVPGVAEGDEVLLLGEGPDGLVAPLEMAAWVGTNRNELVAGLGRRVPRVYSRGGESVRVVDYLAAP